MPPRLRQRSPLSRQLKDLEDELGKQLLIRGSRKVTLTEDGMLLRKRAEEMVDLMEKTKAELTSSAENIIGDAGYVTERLDKGLIDFGLLVGPVDVERFNYLRLPMKDVWGALMRKDSTLAKKDTVCAEDLWDKPLIVSHQTSNNSEISAWMKTDLSKLNIVMYYDLIYNASQFVKKGFGYVIGLDKIINTTGESSLCFRPLSPALEAGLCIIWKKHQVFSKASGAFLDRLL